MTSIVTTAYRYKRPPRKRKAGHAGHAADALFREMKRRTLSPY
jgi:hypothetical protein